MFIGIDLGTSGVKLILVDEKGKVYKTIYKTYPLLMPKPFWFEQDPNEWFQKTISGLKELVIGFENQILGIGFSGQMHGLVILDEEDNVLRNAILWNDQRTVDEVLYLNQVIGIETLLKETGNIALTGLTAPKILWVKHNELELFNRISKVMLPKDYLIYKLTSIFASDTTDLSGTLYFDVENRKYSDKMLEILGLTKKQCPSVFESDEVIGYLNKEWMDALNLSHQVKVTCGGSDQAMGAIGVGVVEEGQSSLSLGTSGVVFVANQHFAIDYKSYLQSYCHASHHYLMMGVMLNAAGALKWWSENILKRSDYENFFNDLMKTTIDESIYFLPYLSGERSPINDPYAQGMFYGLKLHHNINDLNRAVIEGITFALKESLELIENLGSNIQTIRITGGGAKSEHWVQLISTIFNKKVETLEIEEGPALGGAMTAMVGCGIYKTIDEACKTIINVKDVYYPESDLQEIYRKKYSNYKKLYPAIKDIHIDL